MAEEQHNVFEEEVVPAVEYRYLGEILSFGGFQYDETYRDQEARRLQPQLEALGYSDIVWGDGERDSFGPLTRTCRATDSNGVTVYFFYG